MHGKCGQQSKNPLVQICLGDVKQKEDHDNVEMVVTHMFFPRKSLVKFFRSYQKFSDVMRIFTTSS